jgi:4-alpha-glucanotransferase
MGRKRRCGVLLHISSLPGEYGIGDMGASALEFADILVDSGVEAWQMLPLVPTGGAFSYSPYCSPSAFAGNIMFIDLAELAELGLVDSSDLKSRTTPQSDSVNFERALSVKRELLLRAYVNFRRSDAYKTNFRDLSDEFWNFCRSESWWLEDYALFSVLKEMENDAPWSEWRPSFRSRDWNVLDPLKEKAEVARKLDVCRFEQFIFFKQLDALREKCRERGIELIGDLPIYVAHDSADVWGHQDLFELDGEGRPVCIAGVPPDYFSETGQRWGNPIYRWDKMKEDGYSWWMDRFAHTLRCVDTIRVDHFRGFIGYWSIPESEPTAVNGEWMPGPGFELFHALRRKFGFSDGRMPFIAEDLGVMTADVYEAMEEFKLPGMKVLHFAFGKEMPSNPYVPHNHRHDSVAYVGTHDNNTTAGWWSDEATEEEKKNFLDYTNQKSLTGPDAADSMVRMALSSRADLAVITAQDMLRLDASARMNTPSTTKDNWKWKLASLDGLRKRADNIKKLAVMYGRHTESEMRTSGLL